MTFPIIIKVVAPSDARAWIGLGCWVLVIIVLAMVAIKPALLENDAFLILATAIVITGWVQGPVGWAYQATQGGGEAAESSARIAEEAATAAILTATAPLVPTDTPAGTEENPLIIAGAPAGAPPVHVKDTKP